MRSSLSGLLLGIAMLTFGPGCAATLIPNTDVEDTGENREVVEFVETYRHALEQRDVGQLLRLASPAYFDDNGTPTGDDDIDYDGLREKFNAFADQLLTVRCEIRYRRVTFRSNEVAVDYTYTGNFRVEATTGERWVRRLADNRIVLRREANEYRIVSGM